MLSTSTPGGGGIGVRRGVSPWRCLSGFGEARKQVGIRIAWFGQCLDDGPRGTAERHAARSSLGVGQGDGVVPDVAPRVLPDAETGIGAQSGNGGFRRRGWPRRACLCSPRRTTRRRACARSISPCRAMTTRRDFPSMRVCTIHAFAPDRWTRNPKPGSARSNQFQVRGRRLRSAAAPAAGRSETWCRTLFCPPRILRRRIGELCRIQALECRFAHDRQALERGKHAGCRSRLGWPDRTCGSAPSSTSWSTK